MKGCTPLQPAYLPRLARAERINAAARTDLLVQPVTTMTPAV
jgi:hypothetical protein